MRWQAVRAKVLIISGLTALIAGMVERGPGRARRSTLACCADRLEAGDALFQSASVEIGDAGLDGVEQPVEPLVGLGDPLVAVRLGARGGAGRAPGGGRGPLARMAFQPLRLKQAALRGGSATRCVEPLHRDRAALAAVSPCRALVEQV
jgi:hypothetical protein